MAEELIIDQSLGKVEKYETLIPQIKGLVKGEEDLVANLANVSSALKYGMNFFWVGFYLVKGNQLVLGPFQGPVACTRIDFGKGVCGQAWEKNQHIVVKDVDEFPGHIACSSESKSEIVLVARKNEDVFAVLDIDSDSVGSFDDVDIRYLSQIVSMIEEKI